MTNTRPGSILYGLGKYHGSSWRINHMEHPQERGEGPSFGPRRFPEPCMGQSLHPFVPEPREAWDSGEPEELGGRK